MSKDSAPIDWDSHAAWFRAALSSPRRKIYVGRCGSRKIGSVRFDQIGDAGHKYLVSIMVAPAERGRGFGKALLRAGIAALPGSDLEAEIAVDNVASHRIFVACGFELTGEESNGSTFVRYRRAPGAH